MKTLLVDKTTVAKLVKLVKRSEKVRVADEEGLDIYYRKFWIIAADLVEADIINKNSMINIFGKDSLGNFNMLSVIIVKHRIPTLKVTRCQKWRRQ